MFTYRCLYRSRKDRSSFEFSVEASTPQLAIRYGFVSLAEWLDKELGGSLSYADWYLAGVEILERPGWSYLPLRSISLNEVLAVPVAPVGWDAVKAAARRKWGV